MGLIRSTFLVDPDGRIAKVWPKVKAQGHAEAVIKALDDPRAPPASCPTPPRRRSVRSPTPGDRRDSWSSRLIPTTRTSGPPRLPPPRSDAASRLRGGCG